MVQISEEKISDLINSAGTISYPYMTSKMAIWEGLTNSCEKKRSEKQRRKGTIKASECRLPKNSKKR